MVSVGTLIVNPLYLNNSVKQINLNLHFSIYQLNLKQVV